MRPQNHPIEINQGATFTFRFYVASAGAPTVARTLTGYTARMQVRKNEKSDTVIVELSTANGRLVIGFDHRVTLLLSATVTAALPAGKFKYDIELASDDQEPVVLKPLFGAFTVAEVTR